MPGLHRSVPLVAALLAALAPAAGAAPPRTLTALPAAVAGTWLGVADPSIAVLRAQDGRLVALADDGRTWTIAVPDGCTPKAAGGAAIAAVCAPDRRDELSRPMTDVRPLGVIPIGEGPVTSIDQRTHVSSSTRPGEPDAIGRQWIHSPWEGYHFRVDVYVDRFSGETRTMRLHDGTVADLDAPALTVRLCAPLKPTVLKDTPEREAQPLTLPVTVRGRWALITTTRGPRLRRCGSSRPVTLPGGFEPQVLGDGWVAQIGPVGVSLLRLSDRRRFRVPALTEAQELHFTHGRLYSAGPAGLRVVELPRR
jgi:hypothetical protein